MKMRAVIEVMADYDTCWNDFQSPLELLDNEDIDKMFSKAG